jgi:capsid protein
MAWWNPLSWRNAGGNAASAAKAQGRGGAPGAPGADQQLYDAADNTSENRNAAHYAQYADAGSAAAANDPETRRLLRDRSRGECANNGYAKRAVRRQAVDLVGRGPRTLAKIPGRDDDSREISRKYAGWCKASARNRKLLLMAMARERDGEGPAVLVTNPKLRHKVKLDFRPMEAEQFSSPLSVYGGWGEAKDRDGNVAACVVDGVLFDEVGNVLEYHVLKNHPGDVFRGDPYAFDRLPPEQVLFWQKADRPGAARSVPANTTALPLLAQGRRYTGAALDSAETVAKIAAVLEMPASANTDDDGEDGTGDAPQSLPIKRGSIVTAPDGGKIATLPATQPSTTYPQFKKELLSEAGAGIGLPYHKLAADSSGHNYSSARLDEQGHDEEVEVEAADCGDVVLDRLFDAWLYEASLLRGYLPADLAAQIQAAVDAGEDLADVVPRAHLWPGPRFIDPVKEATGIQIQLENHLTTLEDEWAKRGEDWCEKLKQRAVEIKFLRDNGLTPAQALPSATSPTHPANQPEPAPAPAEESQGRKPLPAFRRQGPAGLRREGLAV